MYTLHEQVFLLAGKNIQLVTDKLVFMKHLTVLILLLIPLAAFAEGGQEDILDSKLPAPARSHVRILAVDDVPGYIMQIKEVLN